MAKFTPKTVSKKAASSSSSSSSSSSDDEPEKSNKTSYVKPAETAKQVAPVSPKKAPVEKPATKAASAIKPVPANKFPVKRNREESSGSSSDSSDDVPATKKKSPAVQASPAVAVVQSPVKATNSTPTRVVNSTPAPAPEKPVAVKPAAAKPIQNSKEVPPSKPTLSVNTKFESICPHCNHTIKIDCTLS